MHALIATLALLALLIWAPRLLAWLVGLAVAGIIALVIYDTANTAQREREQDRLAATFSGASPVELRLHVCDTEGCIADDVFAFNTSTNRSYTCNVRRAWYTPAGQRVAFSKAWSETFMPLVDYRINSYGGLTPRDSTSTRGLKFWFELGGCTFVELGHARDVAFEVALPRPLYGNTPNDITARRARSVLSPRYGYDPTFRLVRKADGRTVEVSCDWSVSLCREPTHLLPALTTSEIAQWVAEEVIADKRREDES